MSSPAPARSNADERCEVCDTPVQDPWRHDPLVELEEPCVLCEGCWAERYGREIRR